MKGEVVPTLHWDFTNNRVRLESSRDRGRRGQLAIRSLQDKRREAAFPEAGKGAHLSWDGNSVQFLFVGSLKNPPIIILFGGRSLAGAIPKLPGWRTLTSPSFGPH